MDDVEFAREAVIVDSRLEAEYNVGAYVEGWGDVRFTLSPYKKKASFRVGGKIVPIDADVRAVGARLANGYV